MIKNSVAIIFDTIFIGQACFLLQLKLHCTDKKRGERKRRKGKKRDASAAEEAAAAVREALQG